jgi:chromate transport protein ChrA
MVFSSIDEEEICYIRKLHYFSFSRLAPLALGLLLFFNAKTLSRNLSFQYMGGITCGVGLSALVMIVLLGRMIPMKKNAFLTFIVGGSSIFMWFANRFKNQVADIATTYPWIVSMYLLITGVLSFFGVFWFEDNLKKPKYQQIVCWILQLVGIWCVSISSWNLLLNVGLVGALLFYEFIQFSSRYQPNWKKLGEKFNRKAATVTKDSDGDSSKIFCTPQRSQKGTSSTFGAQCAAESTPRANFFSPVTRFLQRRPVTPANSIKKYLTKEEYEEQGLKETDAGLQALKDQIRASDDPWSLLKKLSSQTRNKVIDFANGQSHLGSENEENQLDLDFSTSESDSDDDPLNTVSNRSLNRTYNVTHSHSKSPRHTPRENRTSNLRKQVLQKNTLSPRPNWK